MVNPLWIVSLFLGLSELTAGVAAASTSGWVQGLFAIFSVAFPVLIAVGLFVILWKRPFVLYAPGDFSRHTPVESFVNAMRSPSTVTVTSIQSVDVAAATAAASALDRIGAEKYIEASEIHEITTAAVAEARRELIQGGVLVRLDLIALMRPQVFVPVGRDTTVEELLDQIWFAISDHVRAYTYGEAWVLAKRDDDENLIRLDSPISMTQRDARTLLSVGLGAGDVLTVLPVGDRAGPGPEANRIPADSVRGHV
ncbi:hypothetical protein [Dactylosporangium sp. NPDC051541]|uniref:hypothetical protein n=1 Tax=Dactylosporangium sp. NPDC051541 TaxID=3363977 RepID=UPI003799B9A8